MITETFVRDVRRDILTMSKLAQVGHIPSALSMADYLSVAFGEFVNPSRDRVILGKPYGAQAYYAVFARCGWIEPLWHKYGSSDPSWTYCVGREHPLVTFIDDTMGNALSVACGVASAVDARVFVNTGDAYFQSGTAWEAILYAGARRLGNLLLTVDNNDMQVLGRTSSILAVEPLADRLSRFEWRTLSADGHDLESVRSALRVAATPCEYPTAVVFQTEKGHGVSFMTSAREWHYRALTDDLYRKAMEELP